MAQTIHLNQRDFLAEVGGAVVGAVTLVVKDARFAIWCGWLAPVADPKWSSSAFSASRSSRRGDLRLFRAAPASRVIWLLPDDARL